MHAKHAASELRAMTLRGAVAACEMRAFAARHAATLDAANHADFVEDSGPHTAGRAPQYILTSPLLSPTAP